MPVEFLSAYMSVCRVLGIRPTWSGLRTWAKVKKDEPTAQSTMDSSLVGSSDQSYANNITVHRYMSIGRSDQS